jgi:FkbM family methyltransferase
MFGSRLAHAMGAVLRRFEFRGKWRLVAVLGRALAGLGLEWLEAAPCSGAKLRVPVRDRIGLLMWAGGYESVLTSLLVRLIEPGWIVFDVGAHIGWYTVLFSRHVGPKGRVHAFEPDPTNFALLQENTGQLFNVVVHPLAVWDSSGAVTFWRTPREVESGWGSLLPDEEPRLPLEVNATTIDEYVVAAALSRVDLIKLDVEGAEGRVLSGAARTLQSLRPIVVSEANAACLARDGLTLGDLVNRFQSYGYRIGWLRSGKAKDADTIFAFPEERNSLKHQLGQMIEW